MVTSCYLWLLVVSGGCYWLLVVTGKCGFRVRV